MNAMTPKLFVAIVWFSTFLQVSAAVTPYPPYPGAAPSLAYRVTVDGQPVFVHRFPTFNQFQWMDHASFAMSGKVHITITSLVNDRNVVTCYIRPLAYNIHPQISGNSISFDTSLFFLTKSRRSKAPACCCSLSLKKKIRRSWAMPTW